MEFLNLKKYYQGVTYTINSWYRTHPWTGDRYLAGYEVRFIPADGSDPVQVAIAKNRHLAAIKAKDCIARFGDEFLI